MVGLRLGLAKTPSRHCLQRLRHGSNATFCDFSNDTMLPTDSSYAMFKLLKAAQLVIYPNANHGAIFQYHDRFVGDVKSFLNR